MSKKRFEVYTLDNGLTVAICKEHYCTDATISLGIKMGPMYETDDNNGASHFIEHMLFKSPKGMSMRKFCEEIDWNGLEVEASTSREHLEVAITCKKPRRVNLSLDLLYKTLLAKKFNPLKFETEKGAILSEIGELHDNPKKGNDFVFDHVLMPALFKDTPLENPVIGNYDTVNSITHDELVEFKNDFFFPENMLLIVAGSFNERNVRKKIKDTFGNLNETGEEYERLVIEPPRVKEKIEIYREHAHQTYMWQGFAIPGYTHEDFLKLMFLSTILGTGYSSRLYFPMVQEEGLGYHVETDLRAYHAGGVFIMRAQFNPKKERRVRQIVKEAYDDLQNRKIKTKELEGIRKMLSTDTHPDSDDIATWLYDKVAYGAEDDIFSSIPAIKKITKDDVLETAQKYLSQPKVEIIIRPSRYRKD